MGMFDEFDSRPRTGSAIDALSGKINEPAQISAGLQVATSTIGIWKIAFGVLLGNLMTGIVVGVIYEMLR